MHGPDHRLSLEDVAPEVLELVVDAWRLRVADTGAAALPG